ncbi:MAG: hypothetical protein ACT4QC_04950 [Planctomycetaceae bacterium]
MTLRWSRGIAIAVCGLLGAICPAVYGCCTGIAPAVFHDEHSYLLAADTFAHGRLTNPSPEFAEFFEAEHVLVAPSYMSKYPPGQGLCLALGQVLVGQPIAGVWLSCGAFAACLCWMLQGWTSRRWAIAITLLFIFKMGGTSSYWSQSYWGGVAAAAGGALVFGGMRRTMRWPTVSASLLMGVGVVVLSITRPFEGCVACLPVAVAMAWWLLRDRHTTLAVRTTRWALPFFSLCLAGGVALANYNQAVAGDWRMFPYVVHERQYFHRDAFCFSKPREPGRLATPRIASFYAGSREKPGVGTELVQYVALKLMSRITEFLARGYCGFSASASVRLETSLWVAALVLGGLRRPRLRLAAIIIGVTLAAQALVIPWWPHYSAPLYPLLYAALADAARRMAVCCRTTARPIVSLAPVVLLSLAGWPSISSNGTTCARHLYHAITDESPAPENSNEVKSREELLKRLMSTPGDHLAFVRYHAQYTVHDEWVYNGADLDGARVIFVHDLGNEKNLRLLTCYPGRRVWHVFVSETAKTFSEYQWGPPASEQLDSEVAL